MRASIFHRPTTSLVCHQRDIEIPFNLTFAAKQHNNRTINNNEHITNAQFFAQNFTVFSVAIGGIDDEQNGANKCENHAH